MILEKVVISLSVLVQLSSAVLALGLIRTTKRSLAWVLLAGAITLMAVRRIESLLLLVADPSRAPDLLFEINGLVLSVMMFAGIYSIRPIFTALAESQKELQSMNAKLRADGGAEAPARPHPGFYLPP